MATSVRPNQVAHQRVRDFNLLESRLRWPSTNLRRFVTFRTHPSQELSVEQPCHRPDPEGPCSGGIEKPRRCLKCPLPRVSPPAERRLASAPRKRLLCR